MVMIVRYRAPNACICISTRIVDLCQQFLEWIRSDFRRSTSSHICSERSCRDVVEHSDHMQQSRLAHRRLRDSTVMMAVSNAPRALFISAYTSNTSLCLRTRGRTGRDRIFEAQSPKWERLSGVIVRPRALCNSDGASVMMAGTRWCWNGSVAVAGCGGTMRWL